MKLVKVFSIGLIFLGLSACSSTGPVLYPNDHLRAVGKEASERDVEACRQLAESAGAREGSGAMGQVATSTAVGAVLGLLRGIIYTARPAQPNQAYTNFVYRCLQEKGYEVTGWQ